jgi:hypothetical protein
VSGKTLPVPEGISAIALCLVATVRLRDGLLYRLLAVTCRSTFAWGASGEFPMNASVSRVFLYRFFRVHRGSNKLQVEQL